MKKLGVFSAFLGLCGWTLLAVSSALAAEEKQETKEKFVVHEWGVQIRTLAVVKDSLWDRVRDEKPKPQSVLVAPDELLADLPAFVLRHSKEFTPTQQSRPWKKPVIHFYGKEDTAISVRVLTPQGRPTAYWPKPELVTDTFWMMSDGLTDAVGMTWKGRLVAEKPAGLPEVKAGHWWKTAREIPSRWVKTEAGSERFIFYEATAVQEPLLVGKISAEELVLENTHAADSGPVMVIANDGEKRHFLAVQNIAGKATVKLSKKDLLAAEGDAEKLLAACRAQWEAFGMTKEEARAIVEIWKPDLLNKAGILVAARVPAEVYDKMFPLEITPKPDEVVRAGVVFDTLPGEAARLGWLPGFQATLEKWSRDLAAEKYEVREAAIRRFLSTGDLCAPFVEKLVKSPDAEVRASAETLLEKLQPGAIDLPRHGKGSTPVNVKR